MEVPPLLCQKDSISVVKQVTWTVSRLDFGAEGAHLCPCRLRQQQQSSQQRFRRQQAGPGHGYAPEGMLATAPYAPVGALQYPVGPRAPVVLPAPTVPMTRSPAFSQGGPMDAMPVGGGGRGRGGVPMNRASQPPAQPQQQPDYGRGGGYYRDMQEYAVGQTAMANAYGLGETPEITSTCGLGSNMRSFHMQCVLSITHVPHFCIESAWRRRSFHFDQSPARMSPTVAGSSRSG
jgi:hypothetical protein